MTIRKSIQFAKMYNMTMRKSIQFDKLKFINFHEFTKV